ncbi:MAG: MFS transporter [Phenylobacterium sp.]|uniref:MFS transporter n=1 Tax=Phenylobacterium ferrooxidans TaxID=2982689 RepID=A0ABW6CL59_9CAUL|nr:MFS transporter [Phenylobacterium sp.]MDO8324573.1 MFS transporter [Phenylobacterium sp.]MDO8913773.1 MFS transporter [Phenylobacterium sp.]MDO9248660.1 MFS transporter [Phenylobacterium sp.]MDP2008863.1 MFS transporter [Phenylobacterium sp.]MDP3100618.1 MFS transporter [Phenylobacterium sp.]
MTFTPRRAVLTLGVTQTIGYACSSYLPATLAKPMAADVGMSTTGVFLAFSAALLLQAVTGPRVGKLVDQRGGRPPLTTASLLFAAGLVGLAISETPVALIASWLIIGLGMSAGLYDIAFAGLVSWFGVDARRSITGVTLIAGFASTIGWPLTAWLEHEIGWRGACLVWAALNLMVALPLHLSLPRAPAPRPAPASDAPPVSDAPAPGDTSKMVLMACAFAVLAAIGSAMSAHLPPLLNALGVGPAAAVGAAALVGPAQVAARLAEFALVRRIHPLVSGRVAVAMFPIGAGLLIAFGAIAAAPFAILYGAGNGLFTIVRGALPLALFGERNYGRRLGVLNVPSRLLQAVSPFVFALMIERSANLALAVMAAGSVLAFGALLLLRKPAA